MVQILESAKAREFAPITTLNLALLTRCVLSRETDWLQAVLTFREGL
jgi:hypothetical protein